MELLNHLATLLVAYMKPLLLKQSRWQRKFLTSCFVCVCHCCVTGATQTVWRPRWLSRYSHLPLAGRPEIFRAVQTEPEADPTYRTISTGSSSQAQSGWGVGLTTHPLLV